MSNAWNFMDFASKGNLLEAIGRESAGMFTLAQDPAAWSAPTGAGGWEVRDVFGHLIDTTETYFVGLEAAIGNGEPPQPVALRDMAVHADAGAREFRALDREAAMERLRSALSKMTAVEEALTEAEWGGKQIPHKYMGPLPAFFYPVFQLVDYAVHSWDIREGSGKPHSLEARSADLLVPLCFVLWSATSNVPADTAPMEIGIRITSGENAGETKIAIGPDGISLSNEPVGGLPAVIDFDPASFVLTAYGRTNTGTIHGDQELAHRFLAGFFRI